jgi:hypothetical protein
VPDARRPGAFEHGLSIHVERPIAEVAVGVDEHVRRPL